MSAIAGFAVFYVVVGLVVTFAVGFVTARSENPVPDPLGDSNNAFMAGIAGVFWPVLVVLMIGSLPYLLGRKIGFYVADKVALTSEEER